MSINFTRDTSGLLFSGDSATLSINNTAITDFKTYIDNQNNLKQNVITAANPLSLVSNTLSLNIDTTTLQIDASTNKLKVIGGGTGSSQWTTDASNNIYNNNNIGIGQTNQNKALLELYSTNQLLPRILLNGREFNSNVDGVALLCGVNLSNNRQLWIGDSANLTKNSTNPIIRLAGSRIDSIATDGITYLKTTLGNSGGVILDGNTAIGTTDTSTYKLNVNGNININGGMYCNTSDNNVFVFDATGGYYYGLVKKSGTYSRLVSVSNPITFSTLTSGNLSQSVSGMTFKDILSANIDGSVSIPSGALLFTTNTNYSAPSMGINGGTGDRLVLAAGLSNAYPYSMGINGGTMWHSVPSGATHKFFINGSELVTVSPTALRIVGKYNGLTFDIDPSNTIAGCESSIINNGLVLMGCHGGDIMCGSYWGYSINLNSSGVTNFGGAPRTKIPNTASFTINIRSSTSSTGFDKTIFMARHNGNIGIGTTSPSCLLDVSGNTASNIVNITQNGTWIGGSGNYALNVSGYSNFNGFRINGGDMANNLYKIASGNIGFTTLSGDFVFNPNQIEKMRILSTGNVTMTNGLSVGSNITATGYIDCGTISINGMYSNYNSGGVDASNLSNTYIAFKPNASNNDFCYLRQIGGDNAIRLCLDFHDDGDDARFVIRNIQSSSNPDGTPIEVFSVSNGDTRIRNSLYVSSSDDTQYGSIKLVTNDTANNGYIEFFNKGVRSGYLGYTSSSTYLQLESENGFTGWECSGDFKTYSAKVQDRLYIYNNQWCMYNGTNNNLIFNHYIQGTNINSFWWFNGADLSTQSQISDERVKRNIEDIDSPLEKILSLKPKTYFLCDEKDSKNQYGFIANDVCMSELVDIDSEYIANIYCNGLTINGIITCENNILNVIKVGDEIKIILDNGNKREYVIGEQYKIDIDIDMLQYLKL